jgi:hypothetical protein
VLSAIQQVLIAMGATGVMAVVVNVNIFQASCKTNSPNVSRDLLLAERFPRHFS